MPPKKNSEKCDASEKATKEKALRKRAIKQKVEKPKLRIPTVMRLKMPSVNSFITCPNQNLAPPNTKKDTPELSPAAQRKFDLANEVALAQLVKPNATTAKAAAEKVGKIPATSKRIKAKLDTPKPKGKITKNKIVSEISHAPAQAVEGLEVASVKEVVPKKKRVFVKKVPPKKIKLKTKHDPKTSNNQKALADSTSTDVHMKRKYVRKQQVPQCDDHQPEAKSTAHKPNAASRPEKIIKRKGKNKMLDRVSTSDHNQSPSLLEEASKILKKEELQPNKESQPIPAPIDSRKTSSSECMSWTKDISSSSTTTCKTVGSNDFVRIDKKLPILRLSNVGNEWKKVNENPIPEGCKFEDAKSSSSSSSDSSTSSSSSSSSSDRQSSRNSIRQSLNLSASSVSPSKSFVTHTSITKDVDWDNALKNISENLKNIDTEAISWVGYQNEPIDRKFDIFHDKIFKLLKLESLVLEVSSNIKNFFRSGGGTAESIENNGMLNAPAELHPNAYTDRSEDDNFQSTQSRYVMFDQNCAPDENSLQSRVHNDEDNNSDEDSFDADKAPFEQTDDDDALSLFAESITGLESSRYNSSTNSICANASDSEEYIPTMISKQRYSEVHNYIPTKIQDEMPLAQNYRNKIICEKQNADSTSVARDTEHSRIEEQPKASDKTPGSNATQMIVRKFSAKMPPMKKPLLMIQIHKPLHGTKSIVFRGVCFYNLISNCKKMRCTFPHVELENNEVRNRLSRLTEEIFIQEYMLLRNWPSLRRRYGILYVMACQDRKLTRILVEMAIDFISKAKLDSVEDAALKINVSERTLLHLNDKDISTCEDLLRFDFGKNILLCHELLRTISESQNFSRFKVVFVKLTNFIKDMGLTFHLDVANHILERVCILPFEESLARAMCSIIVSTDKKIFENSMISIFEKQMFSLDQDTYDRYCNFKENAILILKQVQVSHAKTLSPKISQEIDINLMHDNNEERYTSPDTTKVDNSNKPTDETPQTVQIIRPSVFNFYKPNHSASTSQTVESEDGVKKRPKFRNWRGKGFASPHNLGMRFPRPLVRPLPPPPLKRRLDRRLVALGATPSKFPRRPGPDFF